MSTLSKLYLQYYCRSRMGMQNRNDSFLVQFNLRTSFFLYILTPTWGEPGVVLSSTHADVAMQVAYIEPGVRHIRTHSIIQILNKGFEWPILITSPSLGR